MQPCLLSISCTFVFYWDISKDVLIYAIKGNKSIQHYQKTVLFNVANLLTDESFHNTDDLHTLLANTTNLSIKA